MHKIFAAIAAAATSVLVACGGGGGSTGSGGGSTSTAAPVSGGGTLAKIDATLDASATALSNEAALASKLDAPPGQSPALRPLVSSPFPRENTFQVFATNGTQHTLRLNLSARAYEMLADDGTSAWGTFSEDPQQPGTFIFQSPRITAVVNTARFRLSNDVVVGTFPFVKHNDAQQPFAVQPFIAARQFVHVPAQLDGTYNRFIVNGPNARDSEIHQFSIGGGGTVLRVCKGAALFSPIANCPANALKEYALRARQDGSWAAVADGSDESLPFRVARIGAQNVYLAAGPAPGDATRRLMKIGLSDIWLGPMIDRKALGGTTEGGYGTMRMSRTLFASTSMQPDGTRVGHAYWGGILSGGAELYVQNARGADRYLTMQSDKLIVATSAPGSWGTGAKGYLQIGLVESEAKPLDSRSGLYYVYATNGLKHMLALDFDLSTYGFSDENFHSTQGTFAPDAGNTGTYVFDTARVSTPIRTARFRASFGVPGIVGSFPFAVSPTTPDSFAVQPFVGAMGRASSQAALAGTYNRVSLWPATGLITTQQIRILPEGTSMQTCQDAALRTIASCPAALLSTYQISASSNFGFWRYVNVDNVSDQGEFAMQVVNSQNVYLAAADANASGPALFSIGLPEGTSWPDWQGQGGLTKDLNGDGQLTKGSWSRIAIDATSYRRSATHSDGSTTNATLAVQGPASGEPFGLRHASGGLYTGWIMQSGNLSVMAGRTATTPGIVELGMAD